jgi:hypothetical protein
MNESPERHDPTAVTVANVYDRAAAALFMLPAGAFVVWLPFSMHISRLIPVTVTYLAAVVPALAWLFYRGCRLGARFDDRGVAVHGRLRTERYSWSEVSRFADGRAESGGGVYWVLVIVLRGKPAVTLKTGSLGGRARPEMLATIAQIAERYSVPGELTGNPPPEFPQVRRDNFL